MFASSRLLLHGLSSTLLDSEWSRDLCKTYSGRTGIQQLGGADRKDSPIYNSTVMQQAGNLESTRSLQVWKEGLTGDAVCWRLLWRCWAG
ncbi:hypothetical protein B0T21DRAFT_370041 [Apiosordaria backusii]|uniref:Uncharacterized protein n=1 Tax=Apiosordaria backusii TaxID=314023 RepID=A0AA40B7A5_9PEZI|nr:hypothetical protein B0T21DRAFT_370041 [Apiosordaria backusii]